MRRFDLALWSTLALLLLVPAAWSLDAARVLVATLVCALLALAAPVARAQSELTPRDQLRQAFDRTFAQPGVRAIDLSVWRSGRLVARRSFEMALRREGAGSRTLVRFLEPEYLRGHALLVVHSETGASDTWLYLPDERRARRVALAQKGDSFYGSDLALEDLERPDWPRWRAAPDGEEREGGAACNVLLAWPPEDSQYERIRAWIDRERRGVRRLDFFRRGEEQPVKQLRVAIAGAPEEAGYLRVDSIEIEPAGRDGRTRLEIRRMEIDPNLADRVFSAARLEREGEGLFDLLPSDTPREGR
jgi:hypothetical protein